MTRIRFPIILVFGVCVLDGCAWMAANTAKARARDAAEYEANSASRAANAERLASVCGGIEMMGLYANDTGTGLVEWLAKIRNNTPVARIAQFSWADQYGQTQTGRVQIGGGQIVSPRLVLLEKRPIPPVKNLQLTTCE